MTEEWIVTLDYTSRRARGSQRRLLLRQSPHGNVGAIPVRQNAHEYLESLSYGDRGGCCRCQG